MSHLLHRRRGHDSEDEDEDESIVSGMTTTDYDDEDDDNDYTTSDDEDDSQQERETDSEYDSSENDTETGSEQDDEVQQQPTVMKTKTKAIQQATTTPPTTSSQTAQMKEQVNDQPKPLSSSSPASHGTPMTTSQTVDMDYQDLQQQEKEKTVQELREYRRKLAEDPSFVPYVGLFWGHDDRYREDSLATGGNEATRESMPHFSQHTAASASIKKPSYDRNLDPLMHKKWDHSGYEELMRLEEQDERRKRELIESGQSPSQADHHHRPPPRLPRYHHYNNRGRGRGAGGYRGGYHHQQNRFGNPQKRPYTQQQQQQQQQQEEWPQLATTTDSSSAAAGGHTADQSIWNNNKAQEPNVDGWGSVDRAEEIKPMVKVDSAADRWGTSTAAASVADKGWASAPPTDTPQAERQSVGTEQETPKQDSPKTRTVQNEHGWGALPESTSVNTSTKQKEPKTSATANTISQDNWNVPPPPATTAESSSTGWGEQPTVSQSEGWNTVAENAVSGWSNSDSTCRVETTTVEAAPITVQEADHKEDETRQENASMPIVSPSVATTTDSWGKPEEMQAAQDIWSNNNNSNETKDWNTPQWDATVNNSSDHAKGESKSTSPAPPQKERNEIPPEEKASSSWANVKPDVKVHTTPSDFTKIDFSRRYDSSRRNNSSSAYQQHQKSSSQTTLDDSMQQKWDSKATSDHWGADATTTPFTGWNTTPDNVNTQSEWTTTTPQKTAETSKVEASWDSKSVAKPTSSWSATVDTASTKSTSNWNESSSSTAATAAAAAAAAAATFDQSNSSSSSSARGGWNNSRSSNSANWNADREWNNKTRNEQQSKKGRGYFSGKNTTTTTTDIHAAETASNSTEGFNTPETSAWGHFQSTGDDDSDVEIILEAEEEPEWSKEDEQVLGMTAPADAQQQPYSPSFNRMSKSYLSQHQHDSGQSSSHPEYNRKSTANNGRHSNNNNNNNNNNNKPSHQHRTSQYDDNWRQPREETDAYLPMYYPTPVAHPHPSYMPMIPNGNGTPMYAVPFPMGPTSSSSPSNRVVHSGGSASPSQEPSSSTSPHKFYTPSPPNVQQLPPGYEANGMVYYGMDPSTMYPPPQAFYYYAPPPQAQPPHMVSSSNNNTNDGYDSMKRASISPLHHHQHLQQAEEDDWGPAPDTLETEEQWRTTTMSKSSQHGFQNRKQQPVNQYHYPQHSRHY
ncbi:uncharacterized protein ATC70_002844 [Mucor velutinosus]|uniref:Btz domain-containing protein n=1 Tax=Mucor velutinosus TaxID=708070 RepID=A0AAN7DES3_9FUNG|nr:hypothetical protein ATC70_002844 [Mucor velutinosus]